MAIQSGNSAQINVTPLIDVLLVLLIIFMAIAPTKTVGMNADLPRTPTADTAPAADDTLVVAILSDGSVQLNARHVSREQLGRLLRQAVSLQPNRVVFLKGARELEYREMAGLLDDIRQAGVQRIGLITT